MWPIHRDTVWVPVEGEGSILQLEPERQATAQVRQPGF